MKFERFCKEDDCHAAIIPLAENLISIFHPIFSNYNCHLLREWDFKCNSSYNDFFNNSQFISNFCRELKNLNSAKFVLLCHDLSFNLRNTGKALGYKDEETNDYQFIYTVVETINKLIISYKEDKGNGRFVIDSIKNSIELFYFKEKYAAFHSIATNKLSSERKQYKYSKIKHNNKDEIIEQIMKMDEIEFKGAEVLSGKFSSPDIENCIQKSGYHIFFTNNYAQFNSSLTGENEITTNLDFQLIKFLALIAQPGIITPSAIERNMQIAFNAKANSGCISRQVGAVITDKYHSVKAIGWNDVASTQVPCNLRSLEDLVNQKNKEQFSDFEKGMIGTYEDGESFLTKATDEFRGKNLNELNGRNCSFCFKSFHNVFEGKSNQVHTRSLHAEENAMLQLTKYGGQGVKDGILYTTASPCELCSKKAFQLGVKEIIYIDPYPGIAAEHILTSGKTNESNPILKMFKGAVGSCFHKLYEPIIAQKDEINIMIDLHPKMTDDRIIKKLTSDKATQEMIKQVLRDHKKSKDL